MDKVLIIPAGIYQLPAILKAKEMGFKVITADNRPQNPGHKYADRSEFICIMDQVNILALAKEEKIKAVFTMASDIALKTVSFVTRELGLVETLPCEIIDTICLKNRFRLFQERYNFNHPNFRTATDYYSFQSALKEIGFPLFVKPSDNSGSKGVFYLDNNIVRSDDLQKIYAIVQYFSRNKIVCIEKYLEGLEVGGDALIIDGKVAFYMLTNKYITSHPSYIPTGHSVPSLLSDGIEEKVVYCLQKAINALKIINSPINFDIIIGSDSIFILEMSPRLGGNCIPAIVKLGTGFDMVEASLQISLGNKPKVPKKREVKPTGVRILRSDKDGILTSYRNPEEIKKMYRNVLELTVDYEPGFAVNRYSQGADRIGHLICQSSTIAELGEEMDLIEKELKIYVESF
jgi:biotin carboxylase